MGFPAKHYVPALKLKVGEKDALSTLRASIKKELTPLLQVVENPAGKLMQQHIETAFKRIEPAVSGLGRFFVDPVEVAAAGKPAADLTFAKASGLGVPFTPVTGPSRDAGLTLAALQAKGRTGLAVRVTRHEFESGWLAANFTQFLASHKLSPASIDLIVDLGPVDDMISFGITALAEAFLATIPSIKQWASLTVLASAFPKSMRDVGRASHDFVDRSEWLSWRDGLRLASPTNPRPPTYGDWGIQHPAGVEGFDPLTMQASASIRYATGAQWLLIKGVGTRRVKPSLQMPGLAGQLAAGPLKKQFTGTAHCAGCEMIGAAAQGAPKLGSPTKWRQIGTVHHLTTVVEALQKLP